jgi:alpha-tubulin suppressor-like RCC1 family protein
VVQPVTVGAAKPIAPAVSVAILDASDRRVTGATNSVTLSLATNPLNGTLAGAVTVAAVNGLATFPSLSVDLATTGYTLSATSAGLTGATSSPFSVTAGPPAKLGFVVQPVSTIARTAIPTFSVAVQDADGNTLPTATAFVFVVLGANPGGGLLSGETGAETVNGVATFSGLTINKPGTGYTLVARTGGNNSISGTSASFNLTVGAPAQLAFTQQPAVSRPGGTMTPPFIVEVQDAAGNIIQSASNSITLAIGINAGAGTLSGTTTVSAVNGVASFPGLSINNAGANYTLTAAATNLTGTNTRPIAVRNALVFASVSAGYFHTCGMTTGGAAYCWGDNTTGNLGVSGWPSVNVPIAVSGSTTFAQLVSSRNHTCGTNTGSVAYCWGYNGDGRLGIPVGPAQASPVAVSGGLSFSAASAGYAHSCGVTTAGAGYCWGDNTFGEIGNNFSGSTNAAPAAVSGGLTFASVSPGRLFTCGLTSTAAPYCWGNNSAGQLGDGTVTDRQVPTRVSTVLAFATVTAGGFHSCGLTTGGAAYCWGANDFGQLGNGTTVSTQVPVAVSGGLTFASLSVGNRHNCGVTTSGAAYCWGDNTSGHLGNGTNSNGLAPVAVAGGLTFTSVSAGRFHSCGVVTGGAAYCWGDNITGALGDGTSVANSFIPVPVR